MLMGSFSGCRRKVVVKQRRVTVAPTASKTSPFEMAMEFLNKLDQYQPDQVRIQILDKLRDWAQEEKAAVTWIADPMFRRLPSDLKEKYTADGLSTNSFELFDVLELRQAVWLRDVAQTVAKKPLTEPQIQKWIEEAGASEKLSRDDANDLSLAHRLFDWTIRNVQLDDEQDPVDFVGGQETVDKRDPTTVRHQLYPWQNLLYGHGDFEERSRLFILLARQMGINCVMLVADRGEDQVRQPWAVGVLLGSELYLFDAKLGIPLPGQGGAPFATLSEYVDNPTWLNQLSTDSRRYRIVASDLKRLVASIDATPAALSQRMLQIESRLQGDGKCKHVTNVEIWPFPYRGYQFIEKFNQILAGGDESVEPTVVRDLYQQTQLDQRPFATRGTIMQGRLLQLRGFDRGDFDTPGAKKLYMQSRMSKKELSRFNIPIEQMPKESPLLLGLPEDPADRQAVFDARLQAGREMAVRSKDLATYWLGTISINNQEFKVASDYFKLVVDNDNSRWQQSARYNLARAYEALGEQNNDPSMVQQAIDLYESDQESPQFPGNALRAKLLRTRYIK
jgi:hypothetical protein